jgi:hypothetical protein
MPERPQSDTEAIPPANLPDRVDGYRQIVERVVTEIGEHPEYEMKRACSLQNLPEKMEFVRDIQSIASSRIVREKYLVIGADEKLKAFCPVKNLHEFDEASIRQTLEKYLSPTPVFEVFHLQSSKGCPFVLFVIPKQRRRIVAKVTVTADDPKDLKPKLLLREGDLWTKGSSTGKRLARMEDWDEIYEEVIEAEAENRARIRTAHAVEAAVAREKVKPAGPSALPSAYTDEEFQALMEDLCSRKDEARFKVLLERLRDDTVEGWHSFGAYEIDYSTFVTAVPETVQKIRDHIKNIFRPAIHLLTLAGLYTVKNSGPISFLNDVVDLLQEIFETMHQLQTPKAVVAQGQRSRTTEEHISHTVPALESLISLHLIGAYIAKRIRFEYLRSLFRAEVHSTGWDLSRSWKKRPMVFWPMSFVFGEPSELDNYGGRIELCANRVATDSAYHKLLGTEKSTIDALCQYEFCLELNSFIAFPQLSPETGNTVKQMYPDLSFEFRPDFLAFPLVPVHGLAEALFREVKQGKPQLMQLIVFDKGLVPSLVKPGALAVFAEFLDAIARDHGQVFLNQRRFTPMSSSWPKALGEELMQIRAAKNSQKG